MPTDDPDDSSHSDDTPITLEHAREAILRYLADRDGPVENLHLITIAVRTAELDDDDRSVSDLPYLAVHDSVTIRYLPTLDDEGLVDYNQANGTVTLSAPPDVLESLSQLDDAED